MPHSQNLYTYPVEVTEDALTRWVCRNPPTHRVVANEQGTYDLRNAIDFIRALDTSILAARSGLVTAIQSHVTDNWKWLHTESPVAVLEEHELYGNYVVIEHENNEQTVYAHLQPDSAEVRVGDLIIQGQVLGLLGNTGWSRSPHLHFEVMREYMCRGRKTKITLDPRWDEEIPLGIFPYVNRE